MVVCQWHYKKNLSFKSLNANSGSFSTAYDCLSVAQEYLLIIGRCPLVEVVILAEDRHYRLLVLENAFTTCASNHHLVASQFFFHHTHLFPFFLQPSAFIYSQLKTRTIWYSLAVLSVVERLILVEMDSSEKPNCRSQRLGINHTPSWPTIWLLHFSEVVATFNLDASKLQIYLMAFVLPHARRCGFCIVSERHPGCLRDHRRLQRCVRRELSSFSTKRSRSETNKRSENDTLAYQEQWMIIFADYMMVQTSHKQSASLFWQNAIFHVVFEVSSVDSSLYSEAQWAEGRKLWRYPKFC